MKISYDKEKSRELLNRILAKFDKESEGNKRANEMHVSDLTGCLMKPYCRFVGIEPEEPNDIAKGIMVFGIVAENVLGWTFSEDELQYDSSFGLVEADQDIYGHVDIMEDKTFPIEVKSTRKKVYSAKDIPIYWLEQLMSYLTMHSQNIGWIIFYNIVTTSIIAFKVEMTNQDILDWMIILNERAMTVRNAAAQKDPEIVPIMPKQYMFCQYNQRCPRRDECKERFNEMSKQVQEKRKQDAEKSSPLD